MIITRFEKLNNWYVKLKGIQKLDVKLRIGTDPKVEIEINLKFFVSQLNRHDLIKLRMYCHKQLDELREINLVSYTEQEETG